MNNFLRINKKTLLILLIAISVFFFTTIYFKQIKIAEVNPYAIMNDPKFDIVNPTFTINNKKETISITAKAGNFLSKDLVLLKNNVYFKSKNFKIFSDEVTFDRKEQIANSKKKSRFESDGTEIISEGFSILQQGDIILFNGKTSLVLSQ